MGVSAMYSGRYRRSVGMGADLRSSSSSSSWAVAIKRRTAALPPTHPPRPTPRRGSQDILIQPCQNSPSGAPSRRGSTENNAIFLVRNGPSKRKRARRGSFGRRGSRSTPACLVRMELRSAFRVSRFRNWNGVSRLLLVFTFSES